MILVPDDYYDGVWEYIFLHKVVDVRSLIYNTPLFMEYDFIHPAIFTGRTQELQNMREDIFVNASKEIYNAYKANLTEEEMSRYLLDIPFAKGNNYYIHTSMCENESYNLLCRIIEENYNLSIVYEKNDIILYKFVR
jgi:hypothetical protein